jgi:hypothetical protein
MFQLMLTTFAHRIHLLREVRMNLEMTEQHCAYAHRNWNLQLSQGQENLQPRADVVDHVPLVRGDQDLLGSRKKFGKLLEHAALWHRPNNFGFDFALMEQQHGGNAHDVESTSDIAIVVNVKFCDSDLAWHIGCDLLENWRNLLARPAPFCPEVHQNRRI